MGNHAQNMTGLRLKEKPKQALHIEWNELESIFTDVISLVCKRSIEVESKREEYYYWGIIFPKAISNEELALVFAEFEADELDHDQNDFGDYPIMELCEGLCNKIVNKLLPFEIAYTRADDEGVWFISE